jgi:signal transduction histidine kinase
LHGSEARTSLSVASAPSQSVPLSPFITIQLALIAGITVAFALLVLMLRVAAAGAWLVFWSARFATAYLTAWQVGRGNGASLTTALSTSLLSFICFGALVVAAGLHVRPVRSWSRTSWGLGMLLAGMLVAAVVMHVAAAGSALPALVGLMRLTGALASAWAALHLSRARTTVQGTDTRLLSGLLWANAVTYLAVAIEGELQRRALPPELVPSALSTLMLSSASLATLQALVTFAGAVAAIHLVLADEYARQARRALDVAKAQHLEALGRLTRGIAHDFNNILGAIQFTVEIAREAPTADGRREELARLGAPLERGRLLLDRIEAHGKQEPHHLDRVDAGAALRQLEDVARLLLRPGQRLRIEPPDGPLWLGVDATELERVLSNLVVNARDAMPDGGTIRVSARPQASGAGRRDVAMAALSVHDEGSGIPPEIVHRIFEPYFTTKLPGEGTGLGLAMCRDFAIQNGGDVRVETASGAGTTVTLMLPIVDAAPGAVP